MEIQMASKPKKRKKKDLVEVTAPALDSVPIRPDDSPPIRPDESSVEEVYDQLTPEEFAKRFFGDGSPREAQEGLPSLEYLKSQYKTKSAAIRYLHNLGHPPKIIAKHLGIRYQHARNVCITPLKRGPNEDWRPKKEKDPGTE
jgi:hypothetical protein